MKRIIVFCLFFAIILSACGGFPAASADKWQEQYDLGVRYLSEGNYQEAIIAFSAAIEIDPKRAEAYVGRGNAYVLSGEAEEHLVAAQSDYEMAIELDDTNADAYLGLADVYIRRGEYDKALELLKSAKSKIADGQRLESKISDAQGGVFQAYRKVLDLLYSGYTYGWESYYEDEWNGGLAPVREVEVSYLWYYPYAADEIQSLSDMGYMLIDLDEDGVPELITSIFSEYWGSGNGFIYDLYTYREGKIISLTSSGERYRYYLCSDNSLWYEGSSGAAESYFGYYRINEAKTGLEEMAGDAPTIPLELTSLAGYRPLTEGSNSPAPSPPADGTPTSDTPLLPIDYAGMTIGDLAALWGNDYQLDQYWLSGSAKGLYYDDLRVPLTFYFDDDDYANKAEETDKIIIVEYSARNGQKFKNITPEIPADVTYSQLEELEYPLTLLDESTGYDSDSGASVTVFLEYTPSITIMFDWFDTDPFNSSAEIITISSH